MFTLLISVEFTIFFLSCQVIFFVVVTGFSSFSWFFWNLAVPVRGIGFRCGFQGVFIGFHEGNSLLGICFLLGIIFAVASLAIHQFFYLSFFGFWLRYWLRYANSITPAFLGLFFFKAFIIAFFALVALCFF